MHRASEGTIMLLLVLAGVNPALADFRVVAPTQTGPVSDTPHVSPGDFQRYAARHVTIMRRSPVAAGAKRGGIKPPTSNDVVEGFGAGVPLSFACRQIVPKTVSVVFAPDVDPETLVNWTGGRSWAAVMRDALQPVGLSIVPHGTTIEIKR